VLGELADEALRQRGSGTVASYIETHLREFEADIGR
jgi:hypothetical protein